MCPTRNRKNVPRMNHLFLKNLYYSISLIYKRIITEMLSQIHPFNKYGDLYAVRDPRFSIK